MASCTQWRQERHKGVSLARCWRTSICNYVLDLWEHRWRQKQAKGRVYFVRYADDFVVGLQVEHDAHALWSALDERLRAFGLQLHPDKTRVLQFGRHARQRPRTSRARKARDVWLFGMHAHSECESRRHPFSTQ